MKITDATLCMSEAGEVNCRRHAPMIHSDTWISGRWVVLPRVDLIGINEFLQETEGRTLKCEVCGGTGLEKETSA